MAKPIWLSTQTADEKHAFNTLLSLETVLIAVLFLSVKNSNVIFQIDF